MHRELPVLLELEFDLTTVQEDFILERGKYDGFQHNLYTPINHLCKQGGEKNFRKTLVKRLIHRRRKMKKLFCAAGIFILGIGFLFAQEQKTEEIRITLHECLEMALEKNLDISVKAFEPEIQEFSLRQAKASFMPQLNLDYGNYR